MHEEWSRMTPNVEMSPEKEITHFSGQMND